MSILIKGIDMPKDGGHLHLVVFSNGAVMGYDKNKVCAVDVKAPHGRLIDADVLMDEGMDIYHMDYFRGTMSGYSKQMIDCTPTVLESEGKE